MQSWEYEAYVREESEHTKAIEIAKNLLDILDPATIAKKTGLNENEVKELIEN